MLPLPCVYVGGAQSLGCLLASRIFPLFPAQGGTTLQLSIWFLVCLVQGGKTKLWEVDDCLGAVSRRVWAGLVRGGRPPEVHADRDPLLPSWDVLSPPQCLGGGFAPVTQGQFSGSFGASLDPLGSFLRLVYQPLLSTELPPTSHRPRLELKPGWKPRGGGLFCLEGGRWIGQQRGTRVPRTSQESAPGLPRNHIGLEPAKRRHPMFGPLGSGISRTPAQVLSPWDGLWNVPQPGLLSPTSQPLWWWGEAPRGVSFLHSQTDSLTHQ